MSDPSPGEASRPAARSDWARCWRCGKDVLRVAATCPHCQALRRRTADAFQARLLGTGSPVTQVMVFFGLMLLTSVLFGVLTSFGIQTGPDPSRGPQDQLRLMFGFELLDTALVGAGLLLLSRPRRWPALGRLPQAWMWMLGVVGIALVVFVNGIYHSMLRAYLGVAPERDAVVAATGVTPFLILVYCVQPAVVEELFFRYLALDTLRGVIGVHGAVAQSALIFGLAHVGVPFSIPMLALVGIPLAYARVLSGSVALPMLLHFLHN